MKSLKTRVSLGEGFLSRGKDLLNELLFVGAASVNWWGGWLLASELHGGYARAQGAEGDEGDLGQRLVSMRS
jgi:hypothetical protein